ncbi:MAG TPA: hypothetical protein PLG15_03665 [Candidatus Gastranaerophilaceae bacterium]|nr:hypothetical protein [Candidatus Gastranaerophilaceae bacterium]HPT41462.1 hypothetical protein [Candidatus Gastranaerophilaceae bacterium]
MKTKILILLLSVMFGVNSVYAAPFKADAKTKRIPAGTKLKIELMDSLYTQVGNQGDAFNAMLLEDQKSQTGVILPAGSIIRGSINKVTPIKMLSRGAVLYLDFDHVVTPNGRQLPLSMGVCNRAKITDDGGLYESKGYGEALQKNWQKTVEITQNVTQFGIDAGENSFNGAVFITAPVCAIGGAMGGGAYLLGDSIIDLFRKGSDVKLNKGTVLDVMLTQPIDVPVN